MATMNVSLPEQMKDWVESRSADGKFSNSSDHVRHLIRKDQERTEAIASLQAEIQKGLDSGPAEPFDVEEFLSEMHRKHGDD